MSGAIRSGRSAVLLLAALVCSVTGCQRPAAPGGGGAEVADRVSTTAAVATTPVPDTVAAVPPPAWSTDMEAAVAAANDFACDLYALRRTSGGNVFCSPFSIHTALAMTGVGARGATQAQLLTTLHLADADAAARSGDLGRIVAAAEGDVLSIANALWGQRQSTGWLRAFQDTLTGRFDAGVNEVDFAADPDGSRERINGWVATRTQGRIGELLGPGTITPLTRLVLTNAIAFKAAWDAPFDPARTQTAPFHLADGGQVEAPLMRRRDPAALHAAYDDVQVLVLPYRGDACEMVIVLPATPDGLPAVEERVTSDSLAAWRAAVEPAEVEIWLPRFRLEDGFLVNDALRSLGAVDLFDLQKADLSGMSAADRLVVSAVIHKAIVEVDEEGTTAVAATAVVGNLPGPPPPRPVEFRADRPFLFAIRDIRTGTILFLGRLADPAAAASGGRPNPAESP